MVGRVAPRGEGLASTQRPFPDHASFQRRARSDAPYLIPRLLHPFARHRPLHPLVQSRPHFRLPEKRRLSSVALEITNTLGRMVKASFPGAMIGSSAPTGNLAR